MDVYRRVGLATSRFSVTAVLVALFLVSIPRRSFPFNSWTHSQITHSALNYIATHPHLSAATARWTTDLGKDEGLMRDLLVRAVVDADYQPDMWITGAFHSPFTGGFAETGINLFTTMFHHINVTRPGQYWENDGYAYRYTSGTGNDGLLATPSARLVGELSLPLGGKHPGHPPHGIALPPYRFGFRGTNAEWNHFFRGNNDPTEAVFPPANVPAQLAYAALQISDRSDKTFVDSWSEDLPLIQDLVTSRVLRRHYWRAEIEGIPRGFDLLGIVLHMAQDMAMPHHTEGIASYCHPEIEVFMDQLICGDIQPLDQRPFDQGTYVESSQRCQSFYDSNLVDKILRDWPALDPRRGMPVRNRIKEIALISSRWRWGDPVNSIDFIGTVLPDGTEITGNHCSEFLPIREIREQLRFQYHLAVAATAVIFELAARDYESHAHARGSPTLGNGLPFYLSPLARLLPTLRIRELTP